MKTLVLGAGITGLVAAWHLGKRGEDVEVWEAASSVGGWAQTLDWAGPNGEPGLTERGPLGIRWQPGSEVDRLFRALELSFTVSSSQGPRWLFRKGQLHPRPTTFPTLFKSPLLSPGARLRMMLEPFIPVRRSGDEESLEAFFIRRLGSGFCRELLPGLAAGVLAAPLDCVSAEAIPSLARMEACGSLFRGALKYGSDRTVVPAGGVGSLMLRLAQDVGLLRLGVRAVSIERSLDGRWKVCSDGGCCEAERVVMALPGYAAAPLLGPLLPGVAQTLNSLSYTSLRILHSRHVLAPGVEHGFTLYVHPGDGDGLQGVVASVGAPPKGIPGLMQMRSFLGGTRENSEDGEARVARILAPRVPGWSPAVQVREEWADRAVPSPAPGQMGQIREALSLLPKGLHWIGNPRFGISLKDAVEGLASWEPDVQY